MVRHWDSSSFASFFGKPTTLGPTPFLVGSTGMLSRAVRAALLHRSFLLAQHEQIQALHLLTRPRRFAQKFEAGCDAGVEHEAADMDALPQVVPAVVGDQRSDHRLQRDAVQRVSGLLSGRRLGWADQLGADSDVDLPSLCL